MSNDPVFYDVWLIVDILVKLQKKKSKYFEKNIKAEET